MDVRPIMPLAVVAALVSAAAGCAGQPDASPPASPTQTPGPQPLTVTIAAAGDILPHAPVNASAAEYAQGTGGDFDYAPMFADVAPLLSAADLALCHLETPLSTDNTNLSRPRQLVFNSPHEVALGLAESGFDGC